jgi:hypothetical protein
MSGFEVRAALFGESAGLLVGITWLPEPALQAVEFGTPSAGPADALATLAAALELDFAFVPSSERWAAEAVDGLHEQGVAAIWAVPGVFGRVGEQVGWSEMLRLTAAEPGGLAVHLGEALHEALDDVRAGVQARAEAILVADDVAGATGFLVSPDFVLDALVPCYRSLAREAAAHGLPAIFHSDGDIRTLYPALKKAGYSAVHLAGLAAPALEMPFASARAEGLVVLGGVESAAIMSGARLLGEHAGRLALTGGLLVCDDGGLTSPEEIAAYAAALEAARDTWAAGERGSEKA